MTVQFFYRQGTPVAADELPRVVVGARGESGELRRMEKCDRCGGQGGSGAWAFTGYTCYKCDGQRKLPQTHRVYTAEKLAKLEEAAEKKRQKKAKTAQQKAAAKRVDFIKWAKPRGKEVGDILVAAKLYKNTFLEDLAGKLHDNWILSPNQMSAAKKVIKAYADRNTKDAKSAWVGAVGERIDVEGEIIFVHFTEGFYGTTTIVKFRDNQDNLFVWFASGGRDYSRGDRVAVRGTVKKHDEYKGVKQTVVTRCKVEVFEVMTADEVTEAKEIA